MQEKLVEAIKVALHDLNVENVPITLEHPTDLSHGDYATAIALVVGGQIGENPRNIAERIVEALKKQHIPHIADITVAGPGFINFHFDRAFFQKTIETIIVAGDAYGKSESGVGKTWLIEHTSPNPNKAMHIGHLRNNVTGMAIIRLAEFSGVNVIADAVDNNRGIAIAKLMWGYLKYSRQDGREITDISYWETHRDEWVTPEERNLRPDRFVDELYVKGSADFEEDREVEARVRQMVVDWEANDTATWELWKRVLAYSYEGQRLTLERLGNRWDHVWHEHEHYAEGKELVDDGLRRGIFKQLDDGAVLTDLSSYNLPDTIVAKSDGTSLYITQDLALTKHKREKFHPDKLMWVIGPEQTLAMQQLFAVCEQLGIGTRDDYTHLVYGYMSIKGVGKMSSRKGNVLYIDELIDMVKARVDEATNSTITGSERERINEMVALGAVKYGILKAGRTVDIAFDIDQVTTLEGDSGPYLQYTGVRTESLLAKSKDEGIAISTEVPPSTTTDMERVLYRFPEVVAESLRDYAPQHITQYLILLAGQFNSFYAREKIVDAGDELSPYRVAMTQAVGIVLRNGLRLLGIHVPDRM